MFHIVLQYFWVFHINGLSSVWTWSDLKMSMYSEAWNIKYFATVSNRKDSADSHIIVVTIIAQTSQC